MIAPPVNGFTPRRRRIIAGITDTSQVLFVRPAVNAAINQCNAIENPSRGRGQRAASNYGALILIVRSYGV